MQISLIVIPILYISLRTVDAFSVSSSITSTRRWVSSTIHPTLYASKKTDDNNNDIVPDVVTKASWYAVEAFGNIFKKSGTATTPIAATISTDQPPKSIQETQERIRLDNERSYFLSGTVDTLIYSTDCTFADPFVSFTGRDRFVSNLSNLGSFIT
jgi:hypothetical protein